MKSDDLKNTIKDGIPVMMVTSCLFMTNDVISSNHRINGNYLRFSRKSLGSSLGNYDKIKFSVIQSVEVGALYLLGRIASHHRDEYYWKNSNTTTYKS